MINQQFVDWFDHNENIEKWYSEKSHIDAIEKRILITHLVGNAYGKLRGSRYGNFRWRLFKKTGRLITADSSEDVKVTPEGLLNYEILQPPIDIDPTVAPLLPTVLSPEPKRRRTG